MNRTPMFTKTFSNIEIKIWSYPKDILKCLLKGLSCNLNMQDKIIDVVGFRHFYYEDYGGCNCNEKIEDICFKYSIATHTQRNIYIPIEVINCDNNCHRVFLSELCSIPVTCKSRYPNAINIISDRSGPLSCLLRLPIDRTNIALNKSLAERRCETDCLRQCYDEVIKHLINKFSSEIDCNKDKHGVDKNLIIELCLKNNVSSERIVSILRELEKGPKSCTREELSYKAKQDCQPRHACGRCKSDKGYNSVCPPLSSLPMRKFKIIRVPPSTCHSSSTHDDIDGYSQRIPSQEISSHAIRNKSTLHASQEKSPVTKICDSTSTYTHSKCKDDIQEIKNIINNIITVINSNEKPDCFSFQTSTTDFNGVVGNDNRQLSSEEIINSILQRLSKNKYDSPEPSEIKNILFENGIDTKILSCREEDNTIYQNIQMHRSFPQTIPVISNYKEEYFVPTVDAYDSKIPYIQTPSTTHTPITNEEQNKAIRHALEVAGLPVDLSNYISTLTPKEFHDGVTNIYYYVNSDTGEITIKSIGNEPVLHAKSECIVEEQIPPTRTDVEDRIPASYSHIIVDINFQQEDDDRNVNETNEIKYSTIPSSSQKPSNTSPQPDSLKVGSNKGSKVVEFLLESTLSMSEVSANQQSSSIKTYKIPEFIPEQDGSKRKSNATIPSGSMRSSKAAEQILSHGEIIEEIDESIPAQIGSMRNSKGTETKPESAKSITSFKENSLSPELSKSGKNSKATETVFDQKGSLKNSIQNVPLDELKGSMRNSRERGRMLENSGLSKNVTPIETILEQTESTVDSADKEKFPNKRDGIQNENINGPQPENEETTIYYQTTELNQE